MKQKNGVITATKMQRTVTVTVEHHVYHALYKKRFRRTTKFLADTGDQTDLGVGDKVVITECRPLSKRKRFRITEVLERAPRVSEIVEEEAVTKLTGPKNVSSASSERRNAVASLPSSSSAS